MHLSAFFAGPRLFGVLPDYPDLGESFTYQLTGLLVVFTALGLIWLALTLVGLHFKRTARVAAAKAPAASAPAPAVSSGELSPEMVAVIAAAVQVTLAGSHRIHAIVPLRSGQDWAHEGRRRIFASHQVR